MSWTTAVEDEVSRNSGHRRVSQESQERKSSLSGRDVWGLRRRRKGERMSSSVSQAGLGGTSCQQRGQHASKGVPYGCGVQGKLGPQNSVDTLEYQKERIVESCQYFLRTAAVG